MDTRKTIILCVCVMLITHAIISIIGKVTTAICEALRRNYPKYYLIWEFFEIAVSTIILLHNYLL